MSEHIQIETARWTGAEMDWFRFGHGKEALVLVPGLSVQSVIGTADAVARAYTPLTGDYTIYVLDRRKDLPAGYTMREMAEDTAQALCALGLERVNLFGASQGGMLSMQIAIRHPALVKKLVLGSTSSRVTDEQIALFERWIRLAQAGDAEALYLAFGEALYPQDVFEASKEFLKELARSVTEKELRRFVILAGALRGFDMTEELSQIACPTLVIGDEKDRVVGPEASRIIAARLHGHPGCALHMYDGFGHAAYDTAPDYKDRIARFLAE